MRETIWIGHGISFDGFEEIDDLPADARPHCAACLRWLDTHDGAGSVRLACGRCDRLFCSNNCRGSQVRHRCAGNPRRPSWYERRRKDAHKYYHRKHWTGWR